MQLLAQSQHVWGGEIEPVPANRPACTQSTRRSGRPVSSWCLLGAAGEHAASVCAPESTILAGREEDWGLLAGDVRLGPCYRPVLVSNSDQEELVAGSGGPPLTWPQASVGPYKTRRRV